MKIITSIPRVILKVVCIEENLLKNITKNMCQAICLQLSLNFQNMIPLKRYGTKMSNVSLVKECLNIALYNLIIWIIEKYTRLNVNTVREVIPNKKIYIHTNTISIQILKLLYLSQDQNVHIVLNHINIKQLLINI